MDKRAAWVVTALLLASPASAETLGEAIAAAYESNPQLAAAHARQEALAETPEQERALARPTLSVDGNGGYDHLGGKSASLTANVTLPIWTGGRVSSAVRAANGDVAAGEEGLRDTEAAILQGVVSAYAALLYNQQAVEVARVGIERLDTQVAETRARYNLGKATRTDVAQLEAQRSTVDANLADAEGALATAAATYRATVGHDAGTLTAEVPAPATLPASQDEARQAAETANPLLLKQRLAVDASGAEDRPRASRWRPSLALGGAYGLGEKLSGGSLHDFAAAGSVGMTLHIPLLTGGLVSSRVRQAEANNRAERFLADAAEREALRGADTAWAMLNAARSRLRANIVGLAAADLALKGVRAEYGFGLRSTVDILVADQSFRAHSLPSPWQEPTF
jgi:outer membrane protein